jgi:hypothetical protein
MADQTPEMLNATKWAAACSLAGGMIAASKRPHSMAEAHEVALSCYFTLFPNIGLGRYDMWSKQHDPNKAHE